MLFCTMWVIVELPREAFLEHHRGDSQRSKPLKDIFKGQLLFPGGGPLIGTIEMDNNCGTEKVEKILKKGKNYLESACHPSRASRLAALIWSGDAVMFSSGFWTVPSHGPYQLAVAFQY